MSEVKVFERTIDFLQQMGLPSDDDRELNDFKILRREPAIAVIGLVSRGKSTFVNKLIGVDLLPTGPNPVTFGSGVLRTGPASALGQLRTGGSVKLPTSPEEFKHRARRHDDQDITDFEYSGALRLPEGVILIDTKGLDETSTDFIDDLEGLERSWAAQGAMGAILVTSLPPGPSAQDIRLHSDLLTQFAGNVIVVVKQTDSGLTQSDLDESANIWRQKGADVLVVPDGKPDSAARWGSGPLAEIEDRMSAIWRNSIELKLAARSRLEQSLLSRANLIPVPSGRDVNAMKLRERLWKGLTDVSLLASVREVIRVRLVDGFGREAPSVVTREGAQIALRYASIGSDIALLKFKEGLRPDSELRRVVTADDLMRMVYAEAPGLFEAVFDTFRVSSDEEYVRVSALARELDLHNEGLRVIRRCCVSYIDTIDWEPRLVSLLHLGHDFLASDVIARLMNRWWYSVTQNKPLPEGTQQLESAIEAKSRPLQDCQPRISAEVTSLLSHIAKSSNDWGVTELDRYGQISGQLLGMSTQEVKVANPFAALGETAQRLTGVMNRLNLLARVVDPATADAITVATADVGARSAKVNWAIASRDLVNHDSEMRFSFMTIHGWLAVSAAVFTLVAIANNAIGFTVFFAGLGAFELARWWILGYTGAVRIRPFIPGGKIHGVNQRMKWMHVRSIGIVLFCGALAVVISTVAGSTGSSSDDIEIAARGTQVTSSMPPTTLFTASTTPLTTTSIPRVLLSSDDVIDEAFQDGQGFIIDEVDLTSIEASTIGYAFALSQRWYDLPSEIQVQFCWISSTDQEHSCGESTAVRVLQVTDRVIYGLAAPLPSDTPSDQYKISVEVPPLNGMIMSNKSLVVSSLVPPDSTEVSLPYKTDRSRWWNANCPQILRRNEILPLKICDEGRGVKRVQRLLGLDADGYFGNGTHNAIVDFQYENGLVPTGIVDRDTWYALDESQNGPGVDINGDGLVTPDEFR